VIIRHYFIKSEPKMLKKNTENGINSDLVMSGKILIYG